jgi:TolB-like protein
MTSVMSKGNQRKLAAVLAADVVGYTGLMGEDEAGTLATLRRMRTDLFEPAIESHSGRIAKSMGDGVNIAARLQNLAVPGAIVISETVRRSIDGKLSIVVMPFRNMSGDAEQEYFADGVTEEIITALSKIRTLFVVGRNSSFAFKGQETDAEFLSEDLGVRYILEGSIRKAQNNVRITGQLIDGTTGEHLWADRLTARWMKFSVCRMR